MVLLIFKILSYLCLLIKKNIFFSFPKHLTMNFTQKKCGELHIQSHIQYILLVIINQYTQSILTTRSFNNDLIDIEKVNKSVSKKS